MTELSEENKKNTAAGTKEAPKSLPASDMQVNDMTEQPAGSPPIDEQEQQNLRLVSEIQAKAAAGQSAQAEETELFEHNRGLVIHAAQKYEKLFNHTLGLDDLVNSGSIGLMTAARSYDPAKGAKFSTYATYWIRDSILKEIYNTGFNIRVSNHQFERIMKVQAIKKRYDLEHLEGDAMIDAIVRDSGLSREEVERCLQLDQEVLRQTSLNTKVGNDDGEATELGDIAVSPDNVEDQVLDEQQIQELYDSLDQLSEDERSTLVLRYGLFNGKRHTLREIAELYHVSPEAIRQREQHAIKTIRNAMNSTELCTYRRKHVGFVFQFYNLMPGLSAYENVELAAELSTDPLDAKALIEKVGLAERAAHFPSEMSGGQQQRVAIARALAKNPDILLCDEPTGALDSTTGNEILRLLCDFNREYKKTVILITHNRDIACIADRIFYFKDGSLERITVNADVDQTRERFF